MVSSEQLFLLSDLTVLFRGILHDSKVSNDPVEFRPEWYLKDGKLNPDVRDPDSAAFGLGRVVACNFVDNSSALPMRPVCIIPMFF